MAHSSLNTPILTIFCFTDLNICLYDSNTLYLGTSVVLKGSFPPVEYLVVSGGIFSCQTWNVEDLPPLDAGCCSTVFSTQDSSASQRISQSQKLVVPALRNSAKLYSLEIG